MPRLDDFAFPLTLERGMLSQQEVFLVRPSFQASISLSSLRSRDKELKKVAAEKTISEVSSPEKMSVASKKKPDHGAMRDASSSSSSASVLSEMEFIVRYPSPQREDAVDDIREEIKEPILGKRGRPKILNAVN
jgi:hypothetical protein